MNGGAITSTGQPARFIFRRCKRHQRTTQLTRVRSSARPTRDAHPSVRFNEARSFSPLRRDKEFLRVSFADGGRRGWSEEGGDRVNGSRGNKLRDRQKVTTKPSRARELWLGVRAHTHAESGNYARVALLLFGATPRFCARPQQISFLPGGRKGEKGSLVRSIDTLATWYRAAVPALLLREREFFFTKKFCRCNDL